MSYGKETLTSRTKKKISSPELNRVKRIEGQVRGVHRMLEEELYAPNILVQIRAAKAALTALESNVMESHFRECLREAVKSRHTEEQARIIEELMDTFKKV